MSEFFKYILFAYSLFGTWINFEKCPMEKVTTGQRTSIVEFYFRFNQTFDYWIFSRNSGILWPQHSPYLMPPEYFMWGYFKERVCINKPQQQPRITSIQKFVRFSQLLTTVIEKEPISVQSKMKNIYVV